MITYELWQAPLSCPYKYHHYDWINEKKPTLRDYVIVYSGEIGETENVLDDLWDKFNINPPEDYHGMSMSVSDIICLIDENYIRRWWYVDGIGFKELNWGVEE